MTETQTGVVQSFSIQKRFGWIRLDDGRDVLLHLDALRFSGFQTISLGERVRVEFMKRRRDYQAIHISKINREAA